MPIPYELVKATLEQNQTWVTLPRCADGVDLKEAAKFWAKEKGKLIGVIVSDLEKYEKNFGDDASSALWNVIRFEFGARINWTAKCGLFALWKATYRKAGLKVQHDMKLKRPVQVGDALKAALQGATE